MTTAHKFRLGQTVTVVPPRQQDAKITGAFTIVRILPAEHGNNQYRIKAIADGHERVVTEGQMSTV